MTSVRSNNLSLKYQRFASGFKAEGKMKGGLGLRRKTFDGN